MKVYFLPMQTSPSRRRKINSKILKIEEYPKTGKVIHISCDRMSPISPDNMIKLWTEQHIKLSPPATIDLIKATEKIIDFQFPNDFKAFYLTLDGFADWDWTKNMFSIWPLTRIVEEYHNESNKSFIVFADYLINSHHIGFVKGQKGVFKNSGVIPELIAETFLEALFLINSDADILY